MHKPPGVDALKSKAVTFIELLIVIVIIGILTAVAAPVLKNNFSDLALESSARQVFYLSQYLRNNAVSAQGIYYLKVNPQTCEFRGFQVVSPIDNSKGSELNELTGRFGNIYKSPEGVNILLDPPELSGIYFYPDGSSDRIKIVFENEHKKFSLIFTGVNFELQAQ